jgi:hypothetical protein
MTSFDPDRSRTLCSLAICVIQVLRQIARQVHASRLVVRLLLRACDARGDEIP